MNFLDDLDQLNKNQDDGFRGTNDQVYNEHNYILSPYKNPEFFYNLLNMCKKRFFPYNENGFTQEDLGQIPYIESNLFNSSFYDNVTSLDELQYFHNLRKIYSFSFINCQKLKSVILPKNLQNISSNGFYYCRSLEKVVFPENIQSIESNSFSLCTSLKELILPKNIQFIDDYSFQECSSLEKIIIPKNFKNRIEDLFGKIDLSKVNITYI